MRHLVPVVLALLAPTVFAQQAPAPAGQRPPAFKAHVLSRTELDELLKSPDKLLIIDVRRPDEISTIGGFPVYLSIQIKDLESSLAWVPAGRQIVTVSNHAARAGKAADLFSAKGYKVAGAVGVELYEKEGGSIARIVPPATPANTSPAVATTPN